MKLRNNRVFQPFGVLLTAGVVLIGYMIMSGQQRADKEADIDMVGYDWMKADINQQYELAEVIAKKFRGMQFEWYQILDAVYSVVYERGEEQSIQSHIFFKRRVIDVAQQITRLTTEKQRSAQSPQNFVLTILDPLVESNPEEPHLSDWDKAP